jgi:hypothetical protein
MKKFITKTRSGNGTSHKNTAADPERGADHGDLEKE